MAFRWRTDDSPLIVVFGLDPPSPYQLKKGVEVGPPLTKLSGSAYDQRIIYRVITRENSLVTYIMKSIFTRAVHSNNFG